MGFFGRLFEKKECAFCGGEMGLLISRKLEDGNMCRNCADKLSPWFTGLRKSTVREIEAQLKYREDNRAALQDFRPVRTIGRYYMMHIERNGSVPSRFAVSLGSDYIGSNADIINFRDVSSCIVDVAVQRQELKHGDDECGKMSYDPPRYLLRYDFVVDMTVANNPYFDRIKFRLNRNPVEIETEIDGCMSSPASGHASREDCVYGPSESPEYRKYTEMCDELKLMVECGRRGIPVEVWKKDTKTIVRDAFADALDQLSGRKAGVIDLSPGHAKTDKT